MANIHIYDEFNPEDNAMLQALYSRSAASVTEHVDKVRAAGSGKFMERFYVGYGHLSIADCGSTTIFIENLSILADKAVQDWPLYSGQETSTRYIDMSQQAIIDPAGTPESRVILDKWMKFYVDSQEAVRGHLRNTYPKKENEEAAVYNKAIEARSFDILRGFLPAGITTQLSWHTNLRQAHDKLALLLHHPLQEARQIAQTILDNLKERYPNSFSHKLYEAQEDYREYSVKKYNYYRTGKDLDFEYTNKIDAKELAKYSDLLEKRPIKTNLPIFLGELGTIVFDYKLDFGSFRDIQRHRNGTCRMPLLTTGLGFNNWYLEQLPDKLREGAVELIETQSGLIEKLDISPEEKQYYTALGFNVMGRSAHNLPAIVYLVELRSGKTVHPTLRKLAHKMHGALNEEFPGLKLHSDLEADDWTIRRGQQDIKKK